jgi:hypothetical protein
LYFEIPHLQSVFCDFAEFSAMQDEVMIVAYCGILVENENKIINTSSKLGESDETRNKF